MTQHDRPDKSNPVAGAAVAGAGFPLHGGSLAGKVAVVTGGTRGIGAGIAAALASAGASTIALARSVADPPTSSVEVRACDVTDEASVTQVFDDIVDAHGPIDILVNNAGVSSSNPIGRTTLDDWHHNLSVNATGVFLCSRAVIDPMRAADWGRIVTVASTAALEGTKYIAAYAASKHAALGVMRVASAELAGSGVTANSVCPTFVRTDMTEASIANIAKTAGVDLADAEARLARVTPHGRIIEIDEVVDAVMALITSDHNGQEVLLDGGP